MEMAEARKEKVGVGMWRSSDAESKTQSLMRSNKDGQMVISPQFPDNPLA
jgi:hypothetical protein